MRIKECDANEKKKKITAEGGAASSKGVQELKHI
jgi:phage baseplate assembly protein gpV